MGVVVSKVEERVGAREAGERGATLTYGRAGGRFWAGFGRKEGLRTYPGLVKPKW